MTGKTDKTVRQNALRELSWTGIAAVTGNILQFLQLVIVSKFIFASDYGLMAITLVITYFAQLLGDMGISNALIYKQDVSKEDFSTLFWISLLFCWTVFGLLFLGSPLAAVFFKQPLLASVIRMTSLSFIFLPLQMLYGSLLRKELHFNKMAMGDILSKMVSLLVAVVLAINGSGVFALVYSTLAGLAVSSVLFFFWGRKQMLVGFQFKRRAVGDYLHFGFYQIGNDILTYFNFQIDTILLGKLLGINAAGYYSFAKNLAMKPAQLVNPVINQVAFPLLAKMNNDNASVKNFYLKLIGYLSTLNFFIYPFVAALSVTIIVFCFTANCLPPPPLFHVFPFYGMIRSVFTPIGALLSSKGMVKKLFYWNMALICIIPVLVYFSSPAGVTWVAVALSALLVVIFIPMWKYLIFPACGAGLGEVWQAIRIPFINAVLLFLLLTLFDRLSFPSLAWKFFGGVFVWLVAGFLLTRIINKDLYKEVMGLFKF